MTKVQINCPCGASLEVDGEYTRDQSTDFLDAHSNCIVTREFITLQTVDNVTDFENALRGVISEPLERIATAIEQSTIKLEAIAENMPSRWQGGPK